MAKRRANGEGSIRKRSDGRWEGRYTVGRNPETGKLVYKSVLGKTQAEVREKLAKAIAESSKLDILKAEQYTVSAWLEYWLETYGKLKMRPTTYESYCGNLRVHINPNIGNLRLKKVRSSDIQRFYVKLLTEGRVQRIESKNQPKGLKPKTVKNIHNFLLSAFDKAVSEKLISENPVKHCVLPKQEHEEMKTLPLDKLNLFFEEAKNSGVYEMYLTEMATGLRRGELLGLKWSDIDYEKRTIFVRRQICRIEGIVTEGPLKTKNSYRRIVVPQDVLDVLKNKQINEYGFSDYIFPSPTGGPISPDSVLHMLHRVLERAGLPKIRFHDLRHTFATMALQNGVDVKTVSSILGHFSAGFTLDTYAHVTTSMQQNAAEKVGQFLRNSIPYGSEVGQTTAK